MIDAGEPLEVDIVDGTPGWDAIIDEEQAAAAARIAYVEGWRVADPARAGMTAPAATVAIVRTSDSAVKALNRQFRGIDKPTNVLSFPAADGPVNGAARPLGDVILARETIEREARDLAISPGDHAVHLIVHGTLHLLGYDHGSDSAAAVMERLETELLARLGIADPYAGTEPLNGDHNDASNA